MKKYLRIFYQTSFQIKVIMFLSKMFSKIVFLGKVISVLLDNLLLHLYGLEVSSSSINVRNLVIGHSTGLVLGGNGINCSGTLHVSSGVVFGRRYQPVSEIASLEGFSTKEKGLFDIEGDLTVGANTVLLGPIKITGPVIIGAMSLVDKDILEPGVYVGCPVKKIRDLD